MEFEQFKTLSKFSKGLWADNDAAQSAALETVSAVAMLELSADKSVDKATMALLQRALRDGPETNAHALNHPFYRLSPKERLVLCALHQAQWDYASLAALLHETPTKIAALTYQSRIYLSTCSGAQVPLPVPPSQPGPYCPEFDAANPWTQKFMDEELTQQQQLFFTNHLMICESCRTALNQFREVYYCVQRMLPQFADPAALTHTALRLDRTWRECQSNYWRIKNIGLLRSLAIFFKRREVQIVIAGFLLIMLIKKVVPYFVMPGALWLDT